jgi:transmembrane sensor
MAKKEIVGLSNDISKDVGERAAQWYARLGAPDCTSAERQAFEQWLGAADAHRRAYALAARSAALISGALATDTRWQALLDAQPPAKPKGDARLHRVQRWSIAASIVALGLAVLLVANRSLRPEAVPAAQIYTNDARQQRTITLADGSLVHLDSGAEISALLTAQARRLSLVRGRAYFEVAHDRQRPFTVTSSGIQTLATGTRFEVKLQQQQTVVVTLTEGSVAVSDVGRHAWRETLAPGEQLVYHTTSSAREKHGVDAERAVGWSRGRLYFDGTPLGEVLDEVNRYLATRIVLGDDSLARIPIGGSFAAGGDAAGFVDALAAILPVEGNASGGDRIVLYPRRQVSAQQQ